jgi:hypothetical protein
MTRKKNHQTVVIVRLRLLPPKRKGNQVFYQLSEKLVKNSVTMTTKVTMMVIVILMMMKTTKRSNLRLILDYRS